QALHHSGHVLCPGVVVARRPLEVRGMRRPQGFPFQVARREHLNSAPRLPPVRGVHVQPVAHLVVTDPPQLGLVVPLGVLPQLRLVNLRLLLNRDRHLPIPFHPCDPPGGARSYWCAPPRWPAPPPAAATRGPRAPPRAAAATT